jgi:hypothetical protein
VVLSDVLVLNFKLITSDLNCLPSVTNRLRDGKVQSMLP